MNPSVISKPHIRISYLNLISNDKFLLFFNFPCFHFPFFSPLSKSILPKYPIPFFTFLGIPILLSSSLSYSIFFPLLLHFHFPFSFNPFLKSIFPKQLSSHSSIKSTSLLFSTIQSYSSLPPVTNNPSYPFPLSFLSLPQTRILKSKYPIPFLFRFRQSNFTPISPLTQYSFLPLSTSISRSLFNLGPNQSLLNTYPKIQISNPL